MRYTGLLIAIAGVAFWLAVPEYWEDAKILLNEIHANLTDFILIGLMIAGGLVLVYDYRKSNSEKSDISKKTYQKIHTELKDSLDSLDGTLDRQTIRYEINDKNVNYKHIYMNHKVFDGLVNSGDFNQISHKLQQPLQDIYGKIDIHDEYVKKIVELENDSHEEEYVLILNKREKELLKDIPPIMVKLKKYFE